MYAVWMLCLCELYVGSTRVLCMCAMLMQAEAARVYMHCARVPCMRAVRMRTVQVCYSHAWLCMCVVHVC